MTTADSPATRAPDDGFADLMRKVTRDRGFACASYKERCLKRRVGVRMRARGVLGYAEYARLLDEDTAEYERLMQVLTINVTKLFRNWDAYAAIEAKVVPALWEDAAHGDVRVWSAGCAAGHEAYSLAALFHRYAHATGTTERLSRLHIVGTDVDRQILDVARRAEFAEADFADTPADLRARYFAPDPPFRLDPDVRRLVRFRVGDLLSDGPPLARLELIVCRNVLIYFDRESQERLFESFHAALAPNGFLVFGKVETLFGPMRKHFAPVDARERIFRRA
ncbi:MAG: protein-glutamate O-methyltransferase CheR [Gemmatimonadaceae bacterium]